MDPSSATLEATPQFSSLHLGSTAGSAIKLQRRKSRFYFHHHSSSFLPESDIIPAPMHIALLVPRLSRPSMVSGSSFLLLLLLLLHGEAQEQTAPMEKKEKDSLYSTIQGFVGRWWNGSELYPDPCGLTPVQGVLCDVFDGLWHVTELSLGPVMENSLGCAQDSRFPPSLFELRQLRRISIFSCFTDSARSPVIIPRQGWEKLSASLETLEVRSNRGLCGDIPPGIGVLEKLRSLVLEQNCLSGALPLELGELVHLRKLVLAGNRFSGGVPPSLGSTMRDLLILDLSRNALTGPIPPAAGDLRSLVKLDLSSNLLSGEIPAALGRLGNLALLDLRSNNFSGPVGGYVFLHGMVALKELLLSDNPLGGDMGSLPWRSMQNLTAVGLSNSDMRGELPESIAELKELRFLALDNNRLVGGVPPALESLPAVGTMFLNGNNLTGPLRFSGEFYRRMGKRFAAWGNPNLCFAGAGESGPAGVRRCRIEQAIAGAGEDEVKNDLGGRSSGLRGAALVSPATSYAGGGVLQWGSRAAILVAALLL